MAPCARRGRIVKAGGVRPIKKRVSLHAFLKVFMSRNGITNVRYDTPEIP
jgi:hypothetical protein